MITILHTIYITKQLNSKEYNELKDHLKLISDKLYWDKKNQIHTTHIFKAEGFHKINLRSFKRENISYYQAIEIQLNPKRLIEKNNHVETLKASDIDEVTKKFDQVIEIIDSELPNTELPSFQDWTLKRVDYASEVITPYVKKYIDLFQRGDRPSVYFKELYCYKSNRSKQFNGSLYYHSKSTTINFYDKQSQLLNEGNEVDSKALKDAENYLRIEVQCNKGKTDYLKQKLKFELKQLRYFLDPEISRKLISDYYLKTVGLGDYYKLADAIEIINKSKHKAMTKQNLIEVLTLCNKKRSVWKARDEYVKTQGMVSVKGIKAKFNRYARQIRALNINMVTIPQRWEIDYLENPYNEIMDNIEIEGEVTRTG